MSLLASPPLEFLHKRATKHRTTNDNYFYSHPLNVGCSDALTDVCKKKTHLEFRFGFFQFKQALMEEKTEYHRCENFGFNSLLTHGLCKELENKCVCVQMQL